MERLKISQNMNGNSDVRNLGQGTAVWHFFLFLHRLSVFQISLDGCAFPKSGGASHTCHVWEALGLANENEGPHQAVLIVL